VNTVDAVLVLILFLFALRGYFRGLFRESFSLLGLFFGFMMAIRYDESLAALWKGYWKFSPAVAKAITFVALFFVVYFVLNLIGLILHHSAKFLFLQAINRVGGMALGVGKGSVVLALILFFISSFSWMPQTLRKGMDESRLVSLLSQFGGQLAHAAKPGLLKSQDAKARRRQSTGVL
jgi:membrane protein required for colicin V production